MAFVMNSWYVAAWPNEVGSERMLARTICGRPMIFFRDQNGTAVALEDRCCHREAPLSLGWMESDCTVRCGYHGLRFDARGTCVEIPGQSRIPTNARVRSHPVQERHGWVWVWPGDPDKANPDTIPSMLHRNQAEGWTSVGNTSHVKGHYQLIVDNLMDLTHVTFVHRGSLGDPTVVDSPLEIRHDAQSVSYERWMFDHEPSPFWKRNIVSKLGREVRVDRWQIMRFEPPCFIVLDNGVAPAGRDAKTHPERRAEGVEGCNMNAITPETEDSTHYFWAFARRFLLDDAAMSERLRTEITNVFDQDRVIVEATHKVMKLEPGREVVHLVADRPQNLARALIRQQLTAETAQAPAGF